MSSAHKVSKSTSPAAKWVLQNGQWVKATAATVDDQAQELSPQGKLLQSINALPKYDPDPPPSPELAEKSTNRRSQLVQCTAEDLLILIDQLHAKAEAKGEEKPPKSFDEEKFYDDICGDIQKQIDEANLVREKVHTWLAALQTGLSKMEAKQEAQWAETPSLAFFAAESADY